MAGAVSRDGSVGNDGRDDVVVEVAEALTLNQDVQWDRCARLATPASRRALDGLRVVARPGWRSPRLRVAQETGDRALDAPAAQECPVCGCLTEVGQPAGCDCGLAYVAREVPKLLAGKFRITRRLGSGGMGAA